MLRRFPAQRRLHHDGFRGGSAERSFYVGRRAGGGGDAAGAPRRQGPVRHLHARHRADQAATGYAAGEGRRAPFAMYSRGDLAT